MIMLSMEINKDGIIRLTMSRSYSDKFLFIFKDFFVRVACGKECVAIKIKPKYLLINYSSPSIRFLFSEKS
jgi:hypothetical protein